MITLQFKDEAALTAALEDAAANAEGRAESMGYYLAKRAVVAPIEVSNLRVAAAMASSRGYVTGTTSWAHCMAKELAALSVGPDNRQLIDAAQAYAERNYAGTGAIPEQDVAAAIMNAFFAGSQAVDFDLELNPVTGSVNGQLQDYTRDKCQFCLGAKGGVRGNENRFGEVIVCDYCTPLVMQIKTAAVNDAVKDREALVVAQALARDEDADSVITLLGDLLSRIAVIVKGPEQPLQLHSYHDLPELVAAHVAAPGTVVVTKNDAGQIVAVTRQDEDGRILSVISESAAVSAIPAAQLLTDAEMDVIAARSGWANVDYETEVQLAVLRKNGLHTPPTPPAQGTTPKGETHE